MQLFKASRTVDITEVALALKMEGKRLTSKRGAFCCPFHTDRSPSLYTYADGRNPNTFYCFSCRKYGDGADLAAHILGLKNEKEGAQWICGTFGIEYDDKKPEARPVLIAPPVETQILAAAVRQWKSNRVRYYRDRHALIMQEVDALNVSADSGEAVMQRFDELMVYAARLSEEHDRWASMGVGAVLEEMKCEINKHLLPTMKMKDVPYCGTVS